MEGRRHIIRNLEVAQLTVLCQVAIGRLDQRLLLFLRQVDARQAQGLSHHGRRQRLGGGILHPGPEDTGHQGRAEPGTGADGHEAAA